jgi:NAD(P)-dependent dehydrogenase (short-subunit alcohol dehydrogenase family)
LFGGTFVLLTHDIGQCTFADQNHTAASIPLKRSGLPQDYAETILVLCAGAGYITGQTIVVDGGLTLV